MTQKELDVIVKNQFGDCTAILTTKGADYSEGDDRLANFKEGASRLGLPIMKVWGTYFLKHIAAIEAYIRRGDVKSEPIEGRFADAINYLVLGRAIIEEQKATQKDPHPAQQNMANPAFLQSLGVRGDITGLRPGQVIDVPHNGPWYPWKPNER